MFNKTLTIVSCSGKRIYIAVCAGTLIHYSIACVQVNSFIILLCAGMQIHYIISYNSVSR